MRTARLDGWRDLDGWRRPARQSPSFSSLKSWPPSKVKKSASGESRKSWPLSEVNAGEGSPPRAEGGASVNAYWWTRKVLAENEVDLDDDEDLADGKSRVVFTSVGSR